MIADPVLHLGTSSRRKVCSRLLSVSFCIPGWWHWLGMSSFGWYWSEWPWWLILNVSLVVLVMRMMHLKTQGTWAVEWKLAEFWFLCLCDVWLRVRSCLLQSVYWWWRCWLHFANGSIGLIGQVVCWLQRIGANLWWPEEPTFLLHWWKVQVVPFVHFGYGLAQFLSHIFLGKVRSCCLVVGSSQSLWRQNFEIFWIQRKRFSLVCSVVPWNIHLRRRDHHRHPYDPRWCLRTTFA